MPAVSQTDACSDGSDVRIEPGAKEYVERRKFKQPDRSRSPT